MINKIKLFRLIKDDMTQRELAEKAGVTRQTIIAIEKGSFNPSVKLALKISKILEADVESLFFLEEND
ncbi:helix-turn-helix transcriptional regulator [candidate division WOR-3 bacterium]|nr:helix-turn-helix transcriptional regulator [candidate division WOR-3 bacterium]